MKKKSIEDVILTGKAKEKETEELHREEWKYPSRSCNKCILYPCFKGQENMKADYAKYGCKNFEEDKLVNL